MTCNEPPTTPCEESEIFDAARARIADRSAVIAVVGLGYVGLPVVREFHRAGFEVLGFDTDENKITLLSRAEPYLGHVGIDLPKELRDSGRFTATSDPEALERADVVILCVPTPLTPQRDPDLTFVRESAQLAARTARPGRLVVLESTTYPGTTREFVLSPLEEHGFRVGFDAFVAYSPERYDPGRKVALSAIPKLIGGVDSRSLELATEFYRLAFDDVRPVESCEVAESAKLVENVYRAVNIALVNELKPLFHDMNIDLWDVLEAAASKPYGFERFQPGPGLGGHCLPIDPFYLTWKAKEFGHRTRFIELAGEINTSMPHYIVRRIVDALNERGQSVRNARAMVIGVAYKKNVDDARETPAAIILSELASLGAEVEYHDPWIPRFPKTRYFETDLESIELTAESLSAADVVVVLTDHDACDWPLVAEHAPLVVDTRNALSGCTPRGTWIRS